MGEIIRRARRPAGCGPRRLAPPGQARKWTGFSWAGLVILGVICLALAFPKPAAAAAVGRFVQVTGKVDLLKQGKEPATAAKEQDEVEPNDIIQTHGGAKAQIKFIDDSSIILSPESRLKIEEFTFQADKNQRKAVLHFFQGIVEFTVTRIFSKKDPDFLIKTETAIMGIRGTHGMSIKSPETVFLFTFQGAVALGTSIDDLYRATVVGTMEANQIGRGHPKPGANTPIPQNALPILGGLGNKGLRPGPVATTVTGFLMQNKDVTGPPIKPAPPAKSVEPGKEDKTKVPPTTRVIPKASVDAIALALKEGNKSLKDVMILGKTLGMSTSEVAAQALKAGVSLEAVLRGAVQAGMAGGQTAQQAMVAAVFAITQTAISNAQLAGRDGQQALRDVVTAAVMVGKSAGLTSQAAITTAVAATTAAAPGTGMTGQQVVNAVVTAATLAAVTPQLGMNNQQALSAVVGAATGAVTSIASQLGLTALQAIGSVIASATAVAMAPQMGMSVQAAIMTVAGAATVAGTTVASQVGLTPQQVQSTVTFAATAVGVQADLSEGAAARLVNAAITAPTVTPLTMAIQQAATGAATTATSPETQALQAQTLATVAAQATVPAPLPPATVVAPTVPTTVLGSGSTASPAE